MSGLRPFVSTSLERFEFALRLRSHLPNWTSRHPNSSLLETVVPWMWNDMDLDYPRATSDWLVARVNNPNEAQEFFDFLNVAESLRIFLTHYFEMVIRRYGFEVDDCEVDEQLKMDANDLSLPISQYSIDLLEVFLDAHVSIAYQRMRIVILEFCVGNHVSIEQIERYLKQSPSAYARMFRISLLKKLESDAPLKSLVRLLLQLAVVTNTRYHPEKSL